MGNKKKIFIYFVLLVCTLTGIPIGLTPTYGQIESKHNRAYATYNISSFQGRLGNRSEKGINNILTKKWEQGCIHSDFPMVQEGNEVYTSTPITSIDKATGKIKWQSKYYADKDMYVDHKVLIFIEGEQVVALDRKSGQVKWRFTIPDDSNILGPTIRDGLVYIITDESKIYGIDIDSGHLRWRYTGPYGGPISAFSSPVLIGNDLLYINDSKIHKVNIRSKEISGSLDITSGLENSLVVYKSQLLSLTDEGDIVLINPATMKAIWHKKIDIPHSDYILWPYLAIKHDELILSTNDKVFIFSLKDGEITCEYTFQGKGSIKGLGIKEGRILLLSNQDIWILDPETQVAKSFRLQVFSAKDNYNYSYFNNFIVDSGGIYVITYEYSNMKRPTKSRLIRFNLVFDK
ncbi:PQQ-binding-like beta-propeller repeat protein [Paenibacillus sp. FSL R10-2748]|uniref:PQQ-binding-like beta-propeller repeat protein n=1 Tax=Paenibacillus sp. FSL R10-2748 TaxID=2954658 RepID=UPI0030F88829